MAITDLQARRAKFEGKVFKLADGGGLALRITASGKYWVFEYDVPGSQSTNPDARRKTRRSSISFGPYPSVTLTEARQKREDARKLLREGKDPAQARKAAKLALTEAAANTFRALALTWYEERAPEWADGHKKRVLRILERDLFPWIGARPVADISPREVLECVERVQSRAPETAHRALRYASTVLDFAISKLACTSNPATPLKKRLPPAQTEHRAAILDPAEVGALLRAIDGFGGSFVVKCALRLAPIVFLRPGELCAAEWAEIDLAAARWTIPGPRMKKRRDHIVPLSRQALAILAEIQPLTGGGRYVFPGARSASRHLTTEGLLAGLRRLGFEQGEMDMHGWRAVARTLLAEQLGFRRELIEHQQARRVPDSTGAAYNRTEFLDERARMMQAWADYLDALKSGNAQTASVVQFKTK